MEQNDSASPPPIHHSTVIQFASPPKSLFEAVGFRFVAALGITTVLLAVLVSQFHVRHSDYFILLACGGIPVIVLQGGLLAIGAACRGLFSKGLLEERRPIVTIASGILGGALAFGIPILVGHFVTGDIVDAVVVSIPLFIYPLIASTFVFRIVPRPVMEWSASASLPVASVPYSGPIRKAIPVKASRITRLGRGIAMLAWVFPWLGIGISAVTIFGFHTDPGKAVMWVYISVVSAGALCGVTAILGIGWWGSRRVFLPAILGLAFSLFLLGMYYTGYIESHTFPN